MTWLRRGEGHESTDGYGIRASDGGATFMKATKFCVAEREDTTAKTATQEWAGQKPLTCDSMGGKNHGHTTTLMFRILTMADWVENLADGHCEGFRGDLDKVPTSEKDIVRRGLWKPSTNGRTDVLEAQEGEPLGGDKGEAALTSGRNVRDLHVVEVLLPFIIEGERGNLRTSIECLNKQAFGVVRLSGDDEDMGVDEVPGRLPFMLSQSTCIGAASTNGSPMASVETLIRRGVAFAIVSLAT